MIGIVQQKGKEAGLSSQPLSHRLNTSPRIQDSLEFPTCPAYVKAVRNTLGDESWVCAVGHFFYVLESYMTRIYVQGIDSIH